MDYPIEVLNKELTLITKELNQGDWTRWPVQRKRQETKRDQIIKSIKILNESNNRTNRGNNKSKNPETIEKDQN